MAKKYGQKFYIKHCLLGETNKVKNSDKESYVYSSNWIAFDGKGECNFGNEFARNVVIFGVDDSWSSPTDNCRNDFFSVRWWRYFSY